MYVYIGTQISAINDMAICQTVQNCSTVLEFMKV